MEQTSGKIGIREFMAIIILTIGTKLSDDTTSILYNSLYNAAWLAPIISGILSIIPIYFLIKLATFYPKSNLMDVISHLFGKYLGYIVVFFLWVIGSVAIILDTAIYTDIIATMYFTKTPTILLYLILMLVCSYGAKRGLEQIGSVAWAVLPYLVTSLLIALIFTLMHGQRLFLFPLLGPGIKEVIKESTIKLSIYGDFIYLAMLFPYITSHRVIKKGNWFALLFLIFEMSIACIAYVMLFDFESVKALNYPFHETIRSISIGFLTNVETLFLPFWLIATFIRFSIYLYLNGILFGWLFKISNFEYVIPAIAILFVFIGMSVGNPTFTLFILRENILHIVTPIFFSLPCLLWVIAKLKGASKHDLAKTPK